MLHADNINILVSHKNINTLVSTMKKEPQILYDWMLANRLTTERNKNKLFTVFINSKKSTFRSDSGLNIELNGTLINRKDHTKFLAVYIDQNCMYWDYL